MESKALKPEVLLHVATLLTVPMKGLVATVELLDEGATVPFIARYRKEATGNLDEVQIRDIEEKLAYFRELEERRQTVLESIESQGKLTPEQKFLTAPTMPPEELYDLEQDPHEIHNLAASSDREHQAVLKRLRSVLESWIEGIGTMRNTCR